MRSALILRVNRRSSRRNCFVASLRLGRSFAITIRSGAAAPATAVASLAMTTGLRSEGAVASATKYQRQTPAIASSPQTHTFNGRSCVKAAIRHARRLLRTSSMARDFQLSRSRFGSSWSCGELRCCATFEGLPDLSSEPSRTALSCCPMSRDGIVGVVSSTKRKLTIWSHTNLQSGFG
jgi:hypothetical protein